MKNNKNISQTKSESRISKELKQYARIQLGQKSNNIYSVTLPQSQEKFDNKKQLYSKNNYINQTIPTSNYKRNEYKDNKKSSEVNIPNRITNQNHSYYVSKIEKNNGKKYTPRSSYTYKQPESKNLNEKYRERNNISGINNNNKVKKKYETTSYEHPGRRLRNYENNSYQREKEPPKYYRNNPHKYNTTCALNNLGGGTLIAQKICNIIIKGDSSNIEKESTSLSNNRRRGNKNQMIEYEVEEADIKYNYNNKEDFIKSEKNKKIKRKIKTKKRSFNDIIEMQKAQSFQQPKDYNYMPKQKNSIPKFVIGIEDDNKTKNNYNKDKDKNTHLKTDGGHYKIKYNINIKDNNKDNIMKKNNEK